MGDLETGPNQGPERTFAGMPVNWDWRNWIKVFGTRKTAACSRPSVSGLVGPSIFTSCCDDCASSNRTNGVTAIALRAILAQRSALVA